ncbi:MAG: ferredoxin, partial [Polyangiaceae bacterium]
RGSCAFSGSEEIHARLKELLKKRGLAKAEVRPCSSCCLDVCWAGPVIAVEPDNYFYGRVKLEDVEEIVDALERGERVERLVLGEDDFIDPALLKRK